MQLGRRHRQVIGLGICAIAFGVPAVMPRGEAATPLPALRGISAVDARKAGTEPGGSLVATVSWPAGAAERSEICVAVLEDGGRVVDERVGSLEPIPGRPGAGQWAVEDLAAGRYTVYVAECGTPAAPARTSIEPQFLGGGEDVETASWVEVTSGDRLDVGTIALRRSGLETWKHS